MCPVGYGMNQGQGQGRVFGCTAVVFYVISVLKSEVANARNVQRGLSLDKKYFRL